MVNKRSLANLKPPWQPGVVAPSPRTGHPLNQPNISHYLRKLLAETIVRSKDGKRRSLAEAMADTFLKRAAKGDARFAKLIMDHLEPIPSGTNLTINNVLTPAMSEAYIQRVRLGLAVGNGNGNGKGLNE